MLKIHKNYVLDENKEPYAVQIPISEFKHIEEVLENYGLSKLMEEVDGDERLAGEEAQTYEKLKSNVGS